MVSAGADDDQWPTGEGVVPDGGAVELLVAGRAGGLAHKPGVARNTADGTQLVRTVCGVRLTDPRVAPNVPALAGARSELCARCWPAFTVPNSTRRLGHGYAAEDGDFDRTGGLFTFTTFDLILGTLTRWECRWTGAAMLDQPRAWVDSVEVLEVAVSGGTSAKDLQEALSVAALSGAHRVVAWLASRGSSSPESTKVGALLGLEQSTTEGRRRERFTVIAAALDGVPHGERVAAVRRALERKYHRGYHADYVRSLISEAAREGYIPPLKPRGRSGRATARR